MGRNEKYEVRTNKQAHFQNMTDDRYRMKSKFNYIKNQESEFANELSTPQFLRKK